MPRKASCGGATPVDDRQRQRFDGHRRARPRPFPRRGRDDADIAPDRIARSKDALDSADSIDGDDDSIESLADDSDDDGEDEDA